MKNGSYYIPREKISLSSVMKDFEGLTMGWETDPAVARRILPPPLELPDPDHPIAFAYVVNIRDPEFAPWYMEACLGLMSRHREFAGPYFLNLQLSGPGALMGMCLGRENSYLPKKLCERIVVERIDDYARAFVEAKGRRIFDVEAEIGVENEPSAGQNPSLKTGPQPRSGCFVFQQQFGSREARLLAYSNISEVHSIEPATIKSIVMEPSLDDPWAELSVVKPLWMTYGVHSEGPSEVAELARLEGDEAEGLSSYLFAGRWDRSTICKGHQRYGQF